MCTRISANERGLVILIVLVLTLGLGLAPAVCAAASGDISTVAGNGTYGYSGDNGPATSAGLNSPGGVAADGSGNIYISDTSNSVIRKVDSTGTITTVAGNATAGYSGDGGPATSANLSYPQHVAVDASGNIYIADTDNYRIRKVDSTGTITTVAGNGTYGYSGDGGPATSARISYPSRVAADGSGNIYIADASNSVIRKVDSTGTITTVAGNGTYGYSGDGGPATSASLNPPYGVAVDGSGNIYIADTYNYRIRKVDSTGTITTVAGNGTSGYSGDGGPATSASLSYAYDVAVDSSGNIYISDTYSSVIRKVDSTGTITTVAGNGTSGYSGDGGPATSASLNYPYGVEVDGLGNIFIADSANSRIRKVGFASNTYTVTAGAGANGSLDGTTPSPATVNSGSTASFKFNVNTGYHVASVTSTCGPTTYSNASNAVSNYTYTTDPVTTNCAVSATFAINRYTVTAGAGANGSLDTSTPSPQTVNYNSTTAFKFNANTGYYVASVTSTCGPTIYSNASNAVSSYTYTTDPVTAICAVSAGFAPTPLTQAMNLELLVNSFNLPGGTVNSLDAKLDNAIAKLAAGSTNVACNALGAFINEVSAQSSKKISTTQSNQLIAAALGIKTAIGCR